MFRRAFILFAVLVFLLSCGKKGEDIVGTVDKMEVTAPELLANGISTAVIAATVYNTDGEISSGLKVHFTTTAGSISEFAFSDDQGLAFATLKSSASEEDVDVTITATVVDTNKSLKKGTPASYKVSLDVLGKSNRRLGKKSIEEDGSAELKMVFLGVQVNASLDAPSLPADGISKAKLNISVKETTSKKAINQASIALRATYGNVPNALTTDDQGLANAEIVSQTKSGTDTIYVEYGDLISKTVVLKYDETRLKLAPDSANVVAGGKSKLTMTASLLTLKNTPIVGAEIKFSTSDGVISGSAITDKSGNATVELTSGLHPNSNVTVIAHFYELADTVSVAFVENAGSGGLTLSGETQTYRNGASTVQIVATVLDESGKPIANTDVHFTASIGEITPIVTTDASGNAIAFFNGDIGEEDVIATITATIGSMSTTYKVKLLGVRMEVTATPDSIPADGESSAQITMHIKLASTNIAVSNVPVVLSTDLGSIPNSSVTNEEGLAITTLSSTTQAGIAHVTATFGAISKNLDVYFFDNMPNSINLSAEPNFIWVKETGNIEQTILTATVLGVNGQPISQDVKVRFYLQNGPGGGEFIEPSAAGSTTESKVIRTFEGQASVKLRAGTRSGTVEIKAELVDYPQVKARTTNIVIRSGPPYIWIDPSDKNNVETHMTLSFDYKNLAGWNYVTKFNLGVFVGDKYNNPVEQGTAVYLTSTAGIVTTDVRTDEAGEGAAVLTTANPRPYLVPKDGTALSPHTIPNPNDASLMLPIVVPDFEGNEILNTAGDMAENDGVVYVLATTHGRDQFGNDATVYTTGAAVFSGPILLFTVTANKTSLAIGESAAIHIRVYDINGNPPAAGSSLNASSSAGKLAATNLMADASMYGYGSTSYVTYLLNDLNPVDGEPTTAQVTVELNSPNGRASGTVFIHLQGATGK